MWHMSQNLTNLQSLCFLVTILNGLVESAFLLLEENLDCHHIYDTLSAAEDEEKSFFFIFQKKKIFSK
jgi:hypothetical protein